MTRKSGGDFGIARSGLLFSGIAFRIKRGRPRGGPRPGWRTKDTLRTEAKCGERVSRRPSEWLSVTKASQSRLCFSHAGMARFNLVIDFRGGTTLDEVPPRFFAPRNEHGGEVVG